ncbi:PREDICTED: probable protein phosphatase 2C 65 [Lupinus angustifolius]|uniref:probable protein phosphatase 2C 65 n=1 Tax=Lupinus angustifolius TaxID=3871 RepID=UPI00092F2806|nr:PREDICTED: probable protein phosphatase 2C 65 [Lupinus angustifolius]
MGGCCSCHVTLGGRVYDMESESDDHHNKYNAYENGYGGARIMLGESSKFVSMYCKKGGKRINQDALTVWEDFMGEKGTIFCGVFDGHGPLGHKFSQCIRDNLPSKLSEAIKMSQQNSSSSSQHKQNMSFVSWNESFLKSFIEMDEELAMKVDTDGFCGGSTAVTVIKHGDQLIIGNLGDSRAILCTRADDNHCVPIPLTVDLKPDVPSEASRIANCGGRVFSAKEDPGVKRIWMPEEDCPGLAMSRAFGDFCLKNCGLTSVPDVFSRKLSKQDQFVVLASDGVWDVLTNNEVISIVASAPKRSMAAKILVKHAVHAWRHKYPTSEIDDCAVICLFLNE